MVTALHTRGSFNMTDGISGVMSLGTECQMPQRVAADLVEAITALNAAG